MKEILELAMKLNAKFSVQYVDYNETEWTVSYKLTPSIAKQLTEDNSVSRIRLDFPDCVIILNTKPNNP